MTDTTRDETTPTGDPYDLARFLQAQNERQTFTRALEELRRGRKVSHWMWFVFPQVAGLGHSATAKLFAIRSLVEAQTYAAHPVLGSRLRESAQAMLDAPGTSPQAVLGSIDAHKLKSSMTLFARAAPDEALFTQVLDRWFDGGADDATDALLRRSR
jgi:uncharacterized protein (DUF1810 family)